MHALPSRKYCTVQPVLFCTAGLSLGENPNHAATVASILEAHSNNPELSFAEDLHPASPANGAGDDDGSSGDDEATPRDAPPQDPVDWEAPLGLAGEGGAAAAAAAGAADGLGAADAAAAAAAAPWEVEEAPADRGAGSDGTATAAAGGGAVFVGAAERQRLAAVAELGLRFAEAASENGHEGVVGLLGVVLGSLRGLVVLLLLASKKPGSLPCSFTLHPSCSPCTYLQACCSSHSCSALNLTLASFLPVTLPPSLTPSDGSFVCLADAARSALGVLVRSAHLLPPVLAEKLVLRMGQCRMTESARNLAGSVAASKAPGALADPAVRCGCVYVCGGGLHGRLCCTPALCVWSARQLPFDNQLLSFLLP